MPRLTDQTYLQQRRHLREHWLDEPTRAFLLLSSSEQWALHAYYLPSMKLDDNISLEHRHDISAYDLSLPQRAGRALSRLNLMILRLDDYRDVAKAYPKPKRGARYELRILSEVHPEIDIDQFVKILLNYESRG